MTAEGRSSTQRPMWFREGVCTLGDFEGSGYSEGKRAGGEVGLEGGKRLFL